MTSRQQRAGGRAEHQRPAAELPHLADVDGQAETRHRTRQQGGVDDRRRVADEARPTATPVERIATAIEEARHEQRHRVAALAAGPALDHGGHDDHGHEQHDPRQLHDRRDGERGRRHAAGGTDHLGHLVDAPARPQAEVVVGQPEDAACRSAAPPASRSSRARSPWRARSPPPRPWPRRSAPWRPRRRRRRCRSPRRSAATARGTRRGGGRTRPRTAASRRRRRRRPGRRATRRRRSGRARCAGRAARCRPAAPCGRRTARRAPASPGRRPRWSHHHAQQQRRDQRRHARLERG